MGEYDSLIAMCDRLLTKRGRVGVSLYSVGQGVPSDASKPWKPDDDGPDDDALDDVLVADGLRAAFLDPVAARGAQGQFAFHVYLRGRTEASDSIAPDATYAVYIAAAALDGVVPEAGMMLESLDKRYSVLKVAEIKPAEDPILYILSVKD